MVTSYEVNGSDIASDKTITLNYYHTNGAYNDTAEKDMAQNREQKQNEIAENKEQNGEKKKEM